MANSCSRIRTWEFAQPKVYSYQGLQAACLGKYLIDDVLIVNRLKKGHGNDYRTEGLFRKTEIFRWPAKLLFRALLSESKVSWAPRGI